MNEKHFLITTGEGGDHSIRAFKSYKSAYNAMKRAYLFHEYVYDDKGMISIAKGLNADGFRTTFGGLFRQDSISHILDNPKYCGDLLQWRTHSTDFLTKHRVRTSEDDSAESSLIALENTHEGIISKELFEKAQEIREKRTRLKKDGSHHSSKHWFSGKVICGKCGSRFTNSQNVKGYYQMHCSNRQIYGKEIRYEPDGRQYGCDMKNMSEKVFVACMKYVLEYIDTQRDDIIAALKMDIETIQQDNIVFDIEPLQAEIEKLVKKKEKAIDLMIEGLISKDDLRNQTAKYEKEMEKIQKKIYESKNIGDINRKQLEAVKGQIATLKDMEFDLENRDMFKEVLEKIVAQDEGVMDIYLKFLPFGFRIKYHKKTKPATRRNQMIVVDECVNI